MTWKGLDGSGFQLRWGSKDFLFPTSVWIGPQWVRGPLTGTKAVRCGFDRPTAPTADVNISRPPLCLYIVLWGDLYRYKVQR